MGGLQHMPYPIRRFLHACQQPRIKLSARWHAWVQSRAPAQDSLVLTHRNVYILPTRSGLMLAVTLLVLLIASINYQINLGYLLTFLLAGSALASMLVCHETLRGLSLKLLPVQPTHAGMPMPINVEVNNPSNRQRNGLQLQFRGQAQPVWLELPERGHATAQLVLRPQQRGRLELPALRLETHFPIGVFRAWAWWSPAAQVLVYPAAETHPPPLPHASQDESDLDPGQLGTQITSWDGVRPYRRNDPLHRIVWKKAAHHRDLVSRDDEPAPQGQLVLSLSDCHGLGLEEGLSRLCAWVLEAEQSGLRYGLRLPAQMIDPDVGAIHQQRCLEALALC